jgi:hypothetical protein
MPPSISGDQAGSTSPAGSGEAGEWKLRPALSFQSVQIGRSVFPPSAPHLPRYAFPGVICEGTGVSIHFEHDSLPRYMQSAAAVG